MDGIGDGFIMFRDACIVRERIIKDDRFDSRSYKRLIYTLKNIYIDIYIYMCVCVQRDSPPCTSVFKYSKCARFRDVVHVSEMLCTFPSSCARFTAVVHVSQAP